MFERVYYDVVRNQPVARFYYRGTHSHPVRRTILVTDTAPNYIRGYELREGSKVRDLKDAPIKTYRRTRIARECELGPNKHREPGPDVTTLKRMSVLDLLKTGV